MFATGAALPDKLCAPINLHYIYGIPVTCSHQSFVLHDERRQHQRGLFLQDQPIMKLSESNSSNSLYSTLGI